VQSDIGPFKVDFPITLLPPPPQLLLLAVLTTEIIMWEAGLQEMLVAVPVQAWAC